MPRGEGGAPTPIRCNLLLLSILVVLQAAPARAQHSGETYTLENDRLRVTVSAEQPAVEAYRLKDSGGILLGDVLHEGPEVALYRGATAVPAGHTEVTYTPIHIGNNYTIRYQAAVHSGDDLAVEFDLIYTLTRDGLEIALADVVEHDSYYLIDVVLPGVITVRGGDGQGQLAIPAETGRLIDVERASVDVYEYEIDWLNAILAAFAYNADVLGILDTESIENHTRVRVFERGGDKYGALSMRLIHRLAAYDLEEFGPVVPVTDPAYLLKVQDETTVTVSLTGDYDGDGVVSWVDGTKVLRERVNAVPNPYYRDKSFVRAFVDRPPTGRDPTGTSEELPFDDVLQRIREFAAQTDSAAYVLYLLGWQYEGHDSGYPAVDKVNERLGGYDGLVRLIEEAKAYNVTVTFHDNYDDAYKDSPAWDPDIICRDAQGNLMTGGVWEERPSYLICSYTYAMTSGLERVRSTLDRYPIQEAYFIDVLAGGYNGGRKYDFNPARPAGAQKNFEGKLKIIHEFNKRGIDVATEDFTGFFVGHVGSFGNIIAFDSTYFAHEVRIPLIPFIYHGKTSYGMKISDRSEHLLRFLYGQRAERFTNRRSVLTAGDYILDMLPKQKLYGKPMKAYERDGTTQRVVYEDGSVVEVDLAADTYSVTLGDGRVIAKNYTSFVPVQDHVWMASSRDGGPFRYPLPEECRVSERIAVWKLNADGTREAVEAGVVDGDVAFTAAPNAPYQVTCTGGSL